MGAAVGARLLHRSQPRRAGEMNDVQGRAGLRRERSGPSNRLSLHFGWPRLGDPPRMPATGGERFGHQSLHRCPVLRVDAHQDAGLLRRPESPAQRGIVHHETVGVGHVQLHACHSLAEQPGEELAGFGLVLRDGSQGGVEPEVHDRPPIGFGVPRPQRLVGPLPATPREVDHAGRPPAGRRDRSRLEVVGRTHTTHREVEVGVGVDAAGDHEGSGRVDDVGLGRLDPLPDCGDGLAVDQNVSRPLP